MFNLDDCQSFVASVEKKDGSVYVLVLGKGYDNNQDLEFEIKKKKRFKNKQACMDFLTNQTDYDYKFNEDDFEFASHRYFQIDYFGCGVVFDED